MTGTISVATSTWLRAKSVQSQFKDYLRRRATLLLLPSVSCFLYGKVRALLGCQGFNVTCCPNCERHLPKLGAGRPRLAELGKGYSSMTKVDLQGSQGAISTRCLLLREPGQAEEGKGDTFKASRLRATAFLVFLPSKLALEAALPIGLGQAPCCQFPVHSSAGLSPEK